MNPFRIIMFYPSVRETDKGRRLIENQHVRDYGQPRLKNWISDLEMGRSAQRDFSTGPGGFHQRRLTGGP